MEKRNSKGQTEAEFLASYNPDKYEKPSVTVDTLVFTLEKVKNEYELELLMIQRKDHPFIESWGVPGGFVNINESANVAAARELKEETGLDNTYMEQLYTWSDVGRDPRMRVISVSYMMLASKEQLKQIKASDDARDAKWFTVREKELFNNTTMLLLENRENSIQIAYQVTEKDIKNGYVINPEYEFKQMSKEGLAFDHYRIIKAALDRLKNKVEYTPVAFNLLPEEFTLSELQKVYETLSGKIYVAANFRKKIYDQVTPLGKKVKNGANRPSELFKYKQPK